MNIQERIELLAELGDYLRAPADEGMEMVILQAHAENQWFTPENTRAALRAIADVFLVQENLHLVVQLFQEWLIFFKANLMILVFGIELYHKQKLPHYTHLLLYKIYLTMCHKLV